MRGVELIEKLASYGNPIHFEMPTVLENDLTCDMSFSGIFSYSQGILYVPNEPMTGIVRPRNERLKRDLSFA